MKVRHIVATAALGLLGLHAAAQEVKPTFGLRDHTTGSPRYLTAGSLIPINKRYSELSDSERETLHEMWENIAPGDEPPFPLYGLRPLHATLASAQQKLAVDGSLVLIADVDASGQVGEIKVLRSPNSEMTNFVATMLFETKFKPASCAGKPCAMQYPFAFNFVR